MLKCAIVGATGYTGIELIHILSRHGGVCLSALTTRQKKPIPIRQLIPRFSKKSDLKVRNYSFAELKKSADVFFICLPHTEAMDMGKKLYAAGKLVVDLSADYRLKSAGDYPKWYGKKHRYPNLLKKAIYGLSEVNRQEIAEADLIANPGCYPTGSLLALYPLLREKLIDLKSIVIDAKSGVTGAGKKLVASTQFCEVDEDFKAYKVHCHQHTPEINQGLSEISNSKVSVTFVPHLLPVKRGILSTIYLKTKKGISAAKIERAFTKAYAKEIFVRFKGQGTFPALKDVQHTNYCDIGFSLEKKMGRLIVISAIDNLVKGAAGQAVQNMNIRCGFEEEEGLCL